MVQVQPPSSNGVQLSLDELIFFKQHVIHWLAPAKSLWSQMHGHHRSHQLGRGMDFSEVRQYQAGDDIRSIDWRVTARTGKPHTKLFTEEREKPVIVYIDLSASMQFGSKFMLKSVLVAHMASLVSWLAIAQKDRIGAVIDNGQELIELKPTSRASGPLQIMQKVIEVHHKMLQDLRQGSGQGSGMLHALSALSRLCPKGSEVILLSDFTRFLPAHVSRLSQLRRHNQLKFIQIIDPLEQGDTAYRGAELVSNHRKSQWIDFSSRRSRQHLKQAFESHQQSIKSICNEHAIRYASLSSSTPLLQQLSV